MNRKTPSTAMIAIALMLMGTACTTTDASGAAEVVEEVEDDIAAGDSEAPPESPSEDPTTGGSTDSTADAAPGGPLEGAPVPTDAAIGQVDTTYTDTVLRNETNWYRFDITPGSEVRGALTLASNPDSAGGAFCPTIDLTDAGDSFLVGGGMGDGDATTEAIVAQTEPVVLDTNEVYLKIKTDNCLPTLEEQANYEIEFEVTTN